MSGDTGQVKEKKMEKTVNTRSPEGLSCYLRTVSIISKSQAWSGVDNLHLALQFPLPGAESLALCLMQPFDATTTDF